MAVKQSKSFNLSKRVFTFASLVLLVLFLSPSRAFPDDIDDLIGYSKKVYDTWWNRERAILKKEMKGLEEFAEQQSKNDISHKESWEKIRCEICKIEKTSKYDAKNEKLKKLIDSIETCGIDISLSRFNELKNEFKKFQDRMEAKNKISGDLDDIESIKTDKTDLNKPSITIDTGFNGDRAGEQIFYNLGMGASLDYSVYPNEFRFEGGTKVRFQNNEMDENVTNLLVNYDHYIEPWLEIYGFAQRFSDTYMSIQQRYDVGIGCKFEYNLLSSKQAKKKISQYGSIYRSLDNIEGTLGGLDSKKDQGKLKNSVKKLRDIAKNNQETFNKKYTSLELSMAFSLFADLEQAEIEVPYCKIVNGLLVPDTQKIAPPADHRLMLSVRPKLVFRPIDYITLKGHLYFKYPLTGEKRVNEKLDFRRDGYVSLTIGMPEGSKWTQKLSFILEYQYHYDNAPPFLTEEDLKKNNLDCPAITAEDTRHEFLFKVAITF